MYELIVVSELSELDYDQLVEFAEENLIPIEELLLCLKQ